MPNYDYDIALSFAHEDRPFAAELAQALIQRNIKVFYDEYLESELWGEDLFSYLSDLYQNRARFVVMFISKHYSNKLWTNHERRAAQARAFRESGAYILPIRLDDTNVEGILPTIGYVGWHSKSVSSIVDLLIKKLDSASDRTVLRPPAYKLVKKLERSGIFYSIAFSPDGKWLIAGNVDCLVLWDPSSKRKSVDLIQGYTSSLAFSRDGSLLAVARGNNVELWSTSNWTKQAILTEKVSLVYSLSSGSGGVINRMEEKVTSDAHSSTVKDISFSPSGLLATASTDNTVKLWSKELGTELRMIRVPDTANCVEFSPDGKLLVVGGHHFLKILETQDWQELRQITGNRAYSCSAAFTADGETLATTNPDNVGMVILWDTSPLVERDRFHLTGYDLTSLAFVGCTATLAMSDWSGQTKLVDTSSLETLTEAYRTIQVLPHDDIVFGVASSPDGHLIATANRDRSVNVWRFE